MKEVKELNNCLRAAAIENGLCDNWQRAWAEDWEPQELIRRFYLGMDFFLKKRFITNEFIKENFPQYLLRDNGILVDDAYSLLNPSQEYHNTNYAVTLGNTKAKIRVNGRNMATCYICDSSDVDVVARHESFMLIHATDNVHIRARQRDEARLVIIKHNLDVVLEIDGDVIIKYEPDWLKN